MKKIDITPEQERFCKNFVEVIIGTPGFIREIINEHFDPFQHGNLGLSIKNNRWDVDLKVDGEWYTLYSYDVKEAGQDKLRELASILADAIGDEVEDDENEEEKEEAAETPQSNLDREVEELESFLADKGVYV